MLTAWGTDVPIDDPALAPMALIASDPSNTLSPAFQQLIVDLANGTCTTPTLNVTTSLGTGNFIDGTLFSVQYRRSSRKVVFCLYLTVDRHRLCGTATAIAVLPEELPLP